MHSSQPWHRFIAATLFLSGFFLPLSALGQQAVNGYWNDDFGLYTQGGAGLNSTVNALAHHPLTGDVYAGGVFSIAGGMAALRVARWNGTVWEALGTGMNNGVNALDFDAAGNLYAGGDFTISGGAPANRVAVWDGATWSSLGQGVDGRVRAVRVDKATGNVYVGGDFDQVVNGDGSMVDSPKVAMWNGTEWEGVGHGSQGFWVFSLGIDPTDGSLFVGGRLSPGLLNDDYSLVSASHIARWDGVTWEAVETGFLSLPNALVFDSNGVLYVGHNGEGGLARWDRDSWDIPAGGLDGDVSAVLVKDGTVFATGQIPFALQENGQSIRSNGIVALDIDSNSWWTLGTGLVQRSSFNSLALLDVDESVIVGGKFEEAGGIASYKVAQWFTTPPSVPMTYATFQVDMRRPFEANLQTGNGIALLDVFTGSNPGRFFLYDYERDDIWETTIPQPVGETIEYAFVFEFSPNGYNDGGDWVYELDGSAGAREVFLTGLNPVELPLVSFDNVDYEPTDTEYEDRVRHDLRAGNPNNQRFTYSGANTHTWIDLDQLDRTVAISVRWYIKNPGGAPPPGIAVVSSNTYWATLMHPVQAQFTSVVRFDYELIAGIFAPADLRILRREGPGEPWSVMETDVNENDEYVSTVGVTDLTGEWTLGSTTTANPLTADPPGLATNPKPSDGTLNGPIQPILSWDPGASTQTFDLFLWPAGALEPLVPTEDNLSTPSFSLTEDLLFGEDYNWRVVSHNINGPTSGPVWSFTVGTVPDLEVVSVESAGDAFSGQTIDVSWTVTNSGDGGTNVPTWTDAIYVSASSILDSYDATLIASPKNLSSLNPGESYTNTLTVDLPKDVAGSQYVHVVSDAILEKVSTDIGHLTNVLAAGGGRLDEVDESNNTASTSIAITLSPFPDLEVTSIVAPDNVFSGEDITVSWTVRNTGTAATQIGSWLDTVFLSVDDEFETRFTRRLFKTHFQIKEDALGTFEHEGVLEPGEEYQGVALVTLPDDALGTWFLFVSADTRGRGEQLQMGDVFEFNQEFDNWTPEPISITLTPPPDLVVTSVDAPGGIASGQTIDIEWTVENQGAGPVPPRDWKDRVYLSNSPVFNPGVAIVLGSFYQSGILANNESYTGSGLVKIPDGYSGDSYFHVVADFSSKVFEHEFEGNNNGSNPVPAPITLSPYPDLQVQAVSVGAAQATAGQQIALTYELTNAGAAAAEAWEDEVYVSSNPIWNLEDAVRAEFLAGVAPLRPAEFVSRNVAVTVPSGVSGQVYFYVLADGGEALFEYPDVSSNWARSEVVSVASYPPIDLTIETMGNPASVDAGSQLAISSTVRNQGQGRTIASSWSDSYFLSTDNVYDPIVDIPLASFSHEGRLAASNAYPVSQTVKIPDGLQGDYHLISVTDADQVVADTQRGNNAQILPLSITLPAPSDLVVSSITVEGGLQAGQPVQVDWTVQNTGTGLTASERWYDSVYLSSDNRLGQGDLLLGSVERTGGLAAAGTYNQSLTASLPGYAAGAYYVMVQTDTRDDNYEHLAEGNNITRQRIDVVLPPATDLTVSDVIAPVQAVPGQDISISWTVNNAGAEPARSAIREAVFVSTDPVWDPSDPIVGLLERDIDLAPGASGKMSLNIDIGTTYSRNAVGELTGTLPGVVPGLYYAIVRTDLGNAIRETDTANNAASSAGQIETDIEAIALGSSATFSLTSGEGRYYRVDVPVSGEVIQFTLSSDSGGDGAAELFVQLGESPTRGRYDAVGRIPFSAEQQVDIRNSQVGEYYLLVQALTVPDGTQLTLTASVLGYELSGVTPDYGGDTGIVTVRVDGSRFEEGGQLYLRDAVGTLHPAFETHVRNETNVLGRFNLRGQPVGVRDVVYRNPGGAEAVLQEGFQIVEGIGPKIYVETKYPNRRPSYSTVEVNITVGNRGTDNAIDSFLLLGARKGAIVSGGTGGNSNAPLDPAGFDMTNDFTWSFPVEKPPGSVPSVAQNDRGDLFTPIWFYEIPPGEEFTFTVLIGHDLAEGTIKHVALWAVMPASPFTESGALEDVETSIGYQILQDAIVPLLQGVPSSVIAQYSGKQQDADQAERALRDMVGSQARGGLDFDPTTGGVSNKLKGGVAGMLVGALAVAGTCAMGWLPSCGIAVYAIGVAGFGGFGAMIGQGLDGAATTDQSVKYGMDAFQASGLKDIGCAEGQRKRSVATNSDRACGGSYEEAGGKTAIVRSVDPNDLIGPGSFGPDNWVNGRRPLLYRVRFENDSTKATAPAQVVTIEHPLDPDVDVRSFRLGKFGFGPYSFSPPENVSYYRDRLTLSDSLDFDLDVTAGIDVAARKAFWILQTIDPQTGAQPTSDPDIGFLAINDRDGAGEGFVDYTVTATPSVNTGAVIDAMASIVFDINAPLDTPPVFNTVDVDAPTSKVQALPFRNVESTFDISWTSQDVGSGVSDVRLFVSTDGGPFEQYDTPTDAGSVLFVGEENHQYEFYTLAVDNVGNSEALKSSGEAVVLVSTEEGPGGELPETFALHQNYPNPFNPTTTIPFDIAEQGNVELELYDLLGRRVRVIANEEMTPGRYQRRLDLSDLASGIYFYQIRVSGLNGARFRAVNKLVLVK